ncbi:MAG: chitobiase/beta-hexosaminidase C-terminal domain-containing protein [Muribaculaceae bacterium]|nr:chitobiase/beta-hexosaminidase C-terminal domain-containing protein [Muribaculaceae bacterium]
MKNYLKQWAWRALLTLICLLTTSSAWASFNIYVNSTSGDNYIYMWNGGSTNGWPGNKLNTYSTTTINNKSWYVIPISANSTMYILNNGSSSQTGNLSASSDIYVEYSGGTSINDVTNEITNTPDTWTVAGEPAALFGTTWDPSNTANDMTTTDDVNYTWSKENVELSARTVKFKVCKNHGWDTAYPSSDYELSIESNGTYNVTITFNSSTHAVNATATAVQTTPDIYYVRGSLEAFFGSNPWGNNDNVMTTSDDTNYTWTSGQATLAANEAVEFKVVKNGSEWIGDSNGNNITCTAIQAGVYTLTVNYTVHGVPTGTLNLIAATPDAPTFSLAAGTYNSNQSVTLACSTSGATIYYTTDGNEPTTSSTVYSGAIALNGEGTTTIKAIAVKDGLSSAVAEATYIIAYDRYYVVGEPNDVFPSGWTIGDAQLMTANGTTWTWIKTPLSLAENTTIAFKVKKKSGNDETWIPSGANITVSPQYGAGDYALTITYVEGENEPTATLTPLFATVPVFSPAAGTYDCNQNVTITAGNGTIYYTTDGSDPATSSTRIEYTAPIPLHHEDTFTFKAVAVDGQSTSAVATAEYTIKYLNIYLFGSVGKQHTWLYSYTNPELTTSDGINYYGVYDILNMPSYTERQGAGLFLLTTGFGTNWETTQQYMIGATGGGNFWIDGSHNYLGEWVDAAPVGQSDKGWTIIPDGGHGTYEFFYNHSENKFKLAAFDGPTIYVYDYTRPYIYVKDNNDVEFNGEMPGNPIQILDESVGGHSGLSDAGDGSDLGTGTLGWYKFAVPSHDTPITFQFFHNNDKTVVPSGMLTATGDVYYYWDGEKYVQLASRADAANLRRIVAHVRVQGTEVPTCDGVAMNGPSSFYGQMYYWMAVTKYNEDERMVISDGTHHYDNTISSDIYLEWTDAQGENFDLLSPQTLNNRLANKTGRGTIIHMQKNRNTPPTKDDYVLGVDTKVQSGTEWTNTTNLGTTWWGTSLESPWKGTEAWTDGILSNYNNSRYLYMENGLNRGADVYIVTAEDGTEWYTWYCDRSTATIRFGYGEPLNGYPTYTNNKDEYKFFAHYESEELHQNAGELWYVWTPDFDATLDGNGQSRDNGEMLDVTRMYESSAKQKALCSTFRDGNYVYYTDIKGWGDDNVYCYIWSVPGIDWPGVQMVKVGYDDEGHPVYLADLSNYDVSNAEGILFNNGVTDSHATNKRQTGNLTWENHGCYDYLGLIYRIGGNIDVIENEPDGENSSLTLRGVWYSRVKGTLLAKGDNDYNNKSVNSRGYIDFARIVTDDGALQTWDYDQSNWVEIEPSESVSADDLKGLLEMDFTLYGTKLSSVNPRFKAISISNISNGGEYTPNHFTPAHFNGTCFQQRRGDNEWYFFVEPKPNELAEIDWTIYNNGAFYAYSQSGFDGTINVDWSYHDPGYSDANMTVDIDPSLLEDCGVNPGTLIDLNGYSGWLAIIKLAEETPSTKVDNGTQFEANDVAPSTSRTAKYTVYPILLNDDFVTAIQTINSDKPSIRTLKSTRYYNLMGVESSTPFQGVNIIVKEYTDGSRESSKVIMR